MVNVLRCLTLFCETYIKFNVKFVLQKVVDIPAFTKPSKKWRNTWWASKMKHTINKSVCNQMWDWVSDIKFSNFITFLIKPSLTRHLPTFTEHSSSWEEKGQSRVGRGGMDIAGGAFPIIMSYKFRVSAHSQAQVIGK